MKITCQTCQAKYTIADEKVAGKVVKIKCKKCSSTIVVNGNEASGNPSQDVPPDPQGVVEDEDGETKIFMEPPPGAGGGAGGDEWTVNVTDDDQRTMTTAQLVKEIGTGLVTKDTYVWKDGMADWLPASDVPELASRFAAARPAPAPAPAPAPRAVAPAPAPAAAAS